VEAPAWSWAERSSTTSPTQWIFWSAAIIAVPTAVAARLLVPESPVRIPGRVDLRGAAVLALGLTPLLYAIARPNAWGRGSGRTVSGPLSGALGDRLGFKVPLAAGALITAAGLLLISLEHSVEGSVVSSNATIAVGYGLVLAAIPNLIVSAVPQAQTGEAMGVNMLVRSVGGSLGIHVSAAVLAGSVTAASAAPSEDGYSGAFALTAGVAAVAGLVALAIPVTRPSRTAATGPAYATGR
jgi:MFS family permease